MYLRVFFNYRMMMDGMPHTQGVVDIDGVVDQDGLSIDLLLCWPLVVIRVLKHNVSFKPF